MSTFVYPVPGPIYVTSRFNPTRLHPVNKRVMPHNGVDYRCHQGRNTELYAVADGVVEVAAYGTPGGGNYVRIRLDGAPGGVRDARYSHMTKIYVPVGKKVRKGEIIGTAGDTGSATAVHLHLGMVTTAFRYIDPHAFLRKHNAAVLDFAYSTPEKEEDDMTPEELEKGVRNGMTEWFKAVASEETVYDRAVGRVFYDAVRAVMNDVLESMALGTDTGGRALRDSTRTVVTGSTATASTSAEVRGIEVGNVTVSAPEIDYDRLAKAVNDDVARRMKE